MAPGLGLRLRPPAGAVLHVAAEEAQVSVQSPHPTPHSEATGRDSALLGGRSVGGRDRRGSLGQRVHGVLRASLRGRRGPGRPPAPGPWPGEGRRRFAKTPGEAHQAPPTCHRGELRAEARQRGLSGLLAQSQNWRISLRRRKQAHSREGPCPRSRRRKWRRRKRKRRRKGDEECRGSGEGKV